MTLETLITFLTIENNNMNNYIVTFEYRVMVTAFAILAMFIVQPPISEKAMQDGEQIFLGGCMLPHFYLDGASFEAALGFLWIS